MSFFPFTPIADIDAEVFLAAWDDVLSCMKMILLQKAWFFFLYHVVNQKLHLLYRGNFHTFRDPRGQPALSPWLWPLWLCHLLADIVALLGQGGCPPTILYFIHLDHPGLAFTYFWAHCSSFCLWTLFKGGSKEGLCITASLWRILHLDVCGTPEATADSNICFLLCNVILATAPNPMFLSVRNLPIVP